jgi:hypothetical protein
MAKTWQSVFCGKRSALALCIALAALGGRFFLHQADAQTTPPTASAKPAETLAARAPSSPSTAASVRIELTTSPPVIATVTWGRTKLGRITPREPLVIVRDRDSGPLDVVVRAKGFLPVQTRAHTFEDTRLVVKLTRPSQMSTLVGYRIPLDAGAPLDESAVSDGGVIEPAPAADAPSVPPSAAP